VALQGTSNVPFEQLPYQCFQEARKILLADREEKLKQIEVERARIARLKEADPELSGGELRKQNRLRSMSMTLEKLKILADINDPMVKKRFEDGLGRALVLPRDFALLTIRTGDMNKPIYRYLADRKWREYRRRVLVQRLTQMKIIPDVVQNFEPTADVKLAFGSRNILPGDFVESTVSENPCRLSVQLFERGTRLVTIAVVDSDVPNVEKDGFDYRCHFLASNIPITPISPFINLARLSADSQILLPWLPPFAQKGSPYHRISIFVLQQKDNIPIDINVARQKVQHDKFILRSFMTRHMLKPFGATLFRNKWDEGTAGVMMRAGVPGADMELKRIKVEPLPYKRRNPASFR
jgi:large subunit ribosomal protein L35